MNVTTLNSQSINQIRIIPSEETEQNQLTLEPKIKASEQKVNISQAGQINSYMANLPETKQQDIKNYLQSTKEAIVNGSFDAESNINSAPAAFNDLVNQLNLNSEDTLTIMSEKNNGDVPILPKNGGNSVAISTYTAQQSEANSSISDKVTTFYSRASDSLG